MATLSTNLADTVTSLASFLETLAVILEGAKTWGLELRLLFGEVSPFALKLFESFLPAGTFPRFLGFAVT
jgi:hypothetical protein